jgi:hypothetical protein
MKFTAALLLAWSKVSSALEIEGSRAASIYGWLNDVDPTSSTSVYTGDYTEFPEEEDLQSSWFKGE